MSKVMGSRRATGEAQESALARRREKDGKGWGMEAKTGCGF